MSRFKSSLGLPGNMDPDQAYIQGIADCERMERDRLLRGFQDLVFVNILQRHSLAYGDEHDEDCPLCGVDSDPENL